ncbi:peptidoglycan-recognition protein LD isoform X1 [Drosophila grimshawi]|uniref:peptidoglycan-recognition protein LD isoform X1 n=1 Tax=Drosophila grimshawi TaxID=7222 RepID=UPI000C86E83A|nr:peptidoglycan-recognition protein LD isoform X1 [Drosophila grimshawi]
MAQIHCMCYLLNISPTIATRAPFGGDLVTATSSCVGHHSTVISMEPNERTPLLATGTVRPASLPAIYTKECLNWRIIGLLLMFIAGLVLSIYLLWRQTYEMLDNGYKLNLMRHDIWSRAQLADQALLEAEKVVNVFITHTASEECNENCADLLHNMQRKYLGELPFNFLMAGDCETYEARGWQYASSYGTLPSASSLVLAFVGDFSLRIPSTCQLQMARALLWESQRRLKLQPHYQLYVVRNVSRSEGDADALHRHLQNWPLYAGQRKVM